MMKGISVIFFLAITYYAGAQKSISIQRSMDLAAAGASFDAGIIEQSEAGKGIVEVKFVVNISYAGKIPQKVIASSNDNTTKVEVTEDKSIGGWKMIIRKTMPSKKALVKQWTECIDLLEDQRKGSVCFRAIVVFNGVKEWTTSEAQRRIIGKDKDGYPIALNISKNNPAEYSFGPTDSLGKADLGVWNYYTKGSIETQVKTRVQDLTSRMCDWEEIFDKDLNTKERVPRYFEDLATVDSIAGWAKGKRESVYFQRKEGKNYYRMFPRYEVDSLTVFSKGESNAFFLYPGEPSSEESNIIITKGEKFEIKEGRSYKDLYFVENMYLIYPKKEGGRPFSRDKLMELASIFRASFPSYDIIEQNGNISVYARPSVPLAPFLKRVNEMKEVEYCFVPVVTPELPISQYVSPDIEVLIKRQSAEVDIMGLYALRNFEKVDKTPVQGSIVIRYKGKILDENFWKELYTITKTDEVETIFFDFSLDPK